MLTIKEMLDKLERGYYPHYKRKFPLSAVDFSNAKQEDIQSLAIFIEKTPELRAVSFWVEKISRFYSEERGGSILFAAIQKNRNIQEISFDRCGLEELDKIQLDFLLECIKNSSIKTIKIDNTHFTKSPSLVSFLEALSKTQMETLECSSCGLGDLPFDVLAPLITCMTSGSLVSLSLKGNSIGSLNGGEENLEHYREGEKFLLTLVQSKLQHISFRWNLLGMYANYDGWENILNNIQRQGTLKSLDLSDCALNSLRRNCFRRKDK